MLVLALFSIRSVFLRRFRIATAATHGAYELIVVATFMYQTPVHALLLLDKEPL